MKKILWKSLGGLLAGGVLILGCSGPADPDDGGNADTGTGPVDAGPPAETCSDGTMNQDETDVDCGGTCGATCTPGESCGGNGDCTTDICTGGACEIGRAHV